MRYFTIRKGALVTRFGTGTYLGATVAVVKGATAIDWTEGEVVALPDVEVGKYLREYNQLLLEGSIVESTEDAYKAFHVEREKAVEAEAEKAKAEAAKLEAEEADEAKGSQE